MIVADASVVLEFLTGTPTGDLVEAALEEAGSVCAPAHLDVEVAQVLRRLVRTGVMEPAHGGALVELLQTLPVDRLGIDPLLPRIWQLRDDLTAYDAAYVALGEALECPLLTLDERIAGAPGLKLEVLRP